MKICKTDKCKFPFKISLFKNRQKTSHKNSTLSTKDRKNLSKKINNKRKNIENLVRKQKHNSSKSTSIKQKTFSYVIRKENG